MRVICIKQVFDDEEQIELFKEGRQYKTDIIGNTLFTIDEEGGIHTIAFDENHEWVNDKWFSYHFKFESK